MGLSVDSLGWLRLFRGGELGSDALLTTILENTMMIQPTQSTTDTAPHTIEVFFDGGCPLCVREIGLLRRWDRHHRIQFTDIDAPDFSAESLGTTYEDLMSRIQGRLADGTWIEGVEVFRQLYTAVGFGPLVWFTRWPVISQLLTLGYRVFAKNRLRLTGRCLGQSCQIPAAPVAAVVTHPEGSSHD